jgi:cysteinyl-tRNA synthetase
VYYLYQTILDADAILSEADAVSDSADGGPVEAAVAAALLDDLNTAVAVAALSEPLKSMNDLLYTKKV